MLDCLSGNVYCVGLHVLAASGVRGKCYIITREGLHSYSMDIMWGCTVEYGGRPTMTFISLCSP